MLEMNPMPELRESFSQVSRFTIDNREHHKADVFILDSDKMLFLKLLDECGEKFGVVFLVVLPMNNHFHRTQSPRRNQASPNVLRK